MLNARLARLDNQAHEHAHDYHQLVMSLSGRAEFEVSGCGGEVCRMRACLVPGDADHQFAGMGDNRMLILDLDGRDTSPEDLDLLAQLFESPRYPTLDAEASQAEQPSTRGRSWPGSSNRSTPARASLSGASLRL